jgi:deazaflavin-dependent oxidoreductase (nitroreductase family)
MQRNHVAIPRPPLPVRSMDPLVRRLLAIGMPMGPNTLLTVRGRTSGVPRSVGVAVVEIGQRRWIVGAYGEVHWVRNLRAAGEAEIHIDGHPRHVRARAYSTAEAAAWFRVVLLPHIRSRPLPARLAMSTFAREILADPDRAAAAKPVFELHLDP